MASRVLRGKSNGEQQLIYLATAYCFAAGLELIDSPIYLNCEFSLNCFASQFDRMNFMMTVPPRTIGIKQTQRAGAGYGFRFSTLMEEIKLVEEPIAFEVGPEIEEKYSNSLFLSMAFNILLLQTMEQNFGQQLIERIAPYTCQMLESCSALIADELNLPYPPMLFPVDVASLAQTRFINRPDHHKIWWMGPVSDPFLIQYRRSSSEEYGKFGSWG